MNYKIRFKGGAGSGNHGHKGIPGHRGGSLPRDESASGITEQQRSRAKFEQQQREQRGYTPALRPESTATDADFERAYAALAKREAAELAAFKKTYKGWNPVKDSSTFMLEKGVGEKGKPGRIKVQIYKTHSSEDKPWRVFGQKFVTADNKEYLRKFVYTLDEAGKLAEEFLSRK